MKKRKAYFKDLYRPRFHYTSESQVINDPNGLLFLDGEYHMMHQYNIHNHIFWGHAVSTDLLHWKPLLPALAPDSIGQIWSGSAVIDWNNTSGLQVGKEPVLVALFTYNEHVDSQQSQGLAYSNDRGRTWNKYWRNPVLTARGKKDFRDPKVFWYAEDACWIMVLACRDHVEFYRSVNLIDWKYSGMFGKSEGSEQGIWECPDLFCLPVLSTGKEKQKESRWILTVSVNAGAPAGGTGMQYFVGNFDGKSFTNENPPEKVLWLDYGQDFYAGVTWNHIPDSDGRRLMVAWADNWLYRDALPTDLFKGQFSTVRELRLETKGSEILLKQAPVRELTMLYGKRRTIREDMLPAGEVFKTEFCGESLDMKCSFEAKAGAGCVEVRLNTGNSGYVSVGYNFTEKYLYVDRTAAGKKPHYKFGGRQIAPMELIRNQIQLQILADTSQLEVFGNEGETVITDLVFPAEKGYSVEIRAIGGEIAILGGELRELNSVWEQRDLCFPVFQNIVSGKWAETISGLEGDCSDRGCLLSERIYSDFSFSAKIKLTSYGQKSCAGLLFGYQEADTGFYVKLDAIQKRIGLYKDQTVVVVRDFAVNTGRVYELAVRVKNGRLFIALDKIVLIKISNLSYRGGYTGLYTENSVAEFYDVNIIAEA